MVGSVIAADGIGGVGASVIAPAGAHGDRGGGFPERGGGGLAPAGVLGRLSAPDVGGGGLGLRSAAEVVEELAGACGSTAMVVLMHYAAVPSIEAHGPRSVREAIAGGQHLATLAFSEAGSRSHFW